MTTKRNSDNCFFSSWTSWKMQYRSNNWRCNCFRIYKLLPSSFLFAVLITYFYRFIWFSNIRAKRLGAKILSNEHLTWNSFAPGLAPTNGTGLRLYSNFFCQEPAGFCSTVDNCILSFKMEPPHAKVYTQLQKLFRSIRPWLCFKILHSITLEQCGVVSVVLESAYHRNIQYSVFEY